MTKIKILIIFLATLFFLLFLLYFYKFPAFSTNLTRYSLSEARQPTPTTVRVLRAKPLPIITSLFIPYWNIPEDTTSLTTPLLIHPTTLVYFGITPDATGINKTDIGYTNLEKFINMVRAGSSGPNKGGETPPLLALRMLNDDLNFNILEDTNLQNNLIKETIYVARQYGFEGVLLDLEVKAIPTKKITDQITNFASLFSTNLRSNDLKSYITIYGDTFYRARPYDLKQLAPLADGVYIMAYDFHKGYGTQGPNFPLSGASKYGYDLEKMASDFIKYIPPEKMTVVFGMYGYDWKVDEQNRSLKPAIAVTLKQIKQQYTNCVICTGIACNASVKNACILYRDPLSSETNIKYIDDDDRSHQLWFEDEESVKKKIGYLQSVGVSSFSFWTYGYY